MRLNNTEYKILKFINQSNSVSKKDILENIPDSEYGTNSKLDKLILLKAIEYASVKNSQFTGYKITTSGISLLKDLEFQLFNQEKQDFIEKDRIQREKKSLKLAEIANKKSNTSNIIAILALIISVIALFKK